MGANNKISLRERIRLNLIDAMKNAGITQVQLADKLNISKGTVNNWTRGNNSPDVDMVPKICDVLGISIIDLYSPRDSEPYTAPIKAIKTAPSELSDEAKKVARDYEGLDRHGRNMTKIVITEEQKRMAEERRKAETGEAGPKRTKVIPLYYTPAAAGMASPAIGSDFDYIEIDADKAPWNADFAVKIDGDSMEPYIRDGSIVYVNREPLENGDVGIFYIDGDMVCKQYYKDDDGNVHLLSLNRARADADRYIHHRDEDTVMTYYGRVILPRRPLISMA